MIIESLELKNFGPFSSYKIKFPTEDHSCVLLTGKNNEGKSNIIFALRLVALGIQSIKKPQLRIVIDNEVFFKLPQQGIGNVNIGRLLHNYTGDLAQVIAKFSSGIQIIIYIDEIQDLIYADYSGRIKPSTREIIGFIPPLGPLAEEEELLTTKHIEISINSSLAPRHLRNHLKQILSNEEYKLVQHLINDSWPSIKLLECTHNLSNNTLQCFFKEKTIDREIAWAGQGLQVWFQIITHLVRLRHCSLLIFDEPEINLHPEKQNDLIGILNEFFLGDVIIATHSIELINNVNVSHILHIQKSTSSPKIKSSNNRVALDLIRSKIGSNFNLIASQFENCDLLLFTEDTFDFKLINTLLGIKKIKKNIFNIPLHGFSEHTKSIHYKHAYKLLIGKNIPSVVLLDKDYYPVDYLNEIKHSLKEHKIKTIFTPGKEIENCFIHPKLIKDILLPKDLASFEICWNKFYQDEYNDSFGSFLTLHEKFLPKRLDIKTIIKNYGSQFESDWKNPEYCHLMIGGKKALKFLRNFYSKTYQKNLSQNYLNKRLIELNIGEIEKLINMIVS